MSRPARPHRTQNDLCLQKLWVTFTQTKQIFESIKCVWSCFTITVCPRNCLFLFNIHLMIINTCGGYFQKPELCPELLPFMLSFALYVLLGIFLQIRIPSVRFMHCRVPYKLHTMEQKMPITF